ncbi:lysophospholipid acyltransferase family protein [Paenibacillus rubinfantis]|uniref:lysophospholipid acyltransferase family protein n=1 Tax=Paenibacillus rubinfantis TaxID=1720296 RepID=UPI00073E3AEF|nr:lysophospholipid acyltransferase family protein [Paenibacillus rubinfantis]
MSIEKKPGKFVQRLVLSVVRAMIRSRSRMKVERNDTVGLKPPYLILANHVTNWDPLYINCYVDEPISFVAGASLFRNPLLAKLLNYTGAIPKAKFKNDTRTIRGMMKAKQHGRVIGLFPEGNRNWDGTTEPLIYSTAKLVKLLDLPVVIATISGGHLSFPRWAESHRRGPIRISLVKKWDAGAFTNHTPEAIHDLLTEALAHDDAEWQTQTGSAYYGKAPAHYLERLLFICPHCEVPGRLRSEQDLFGCTACGYTVRYTPQGKFAPFTHLLRFPTTRDWNRWQLHRLSQAIQEPGQLAAWEPVMHDRVHLYVSEGEQPFQFRGTGHLRWNADQEASLSYQAEAGQTYTFPFEEMEGINVQLHHKFEFYVGDKLYRFLFFQPRTSAYKWLQFINALKPRTPRHN